MMTNQNVTIYLNTPLLELGLEGEKIDEVFRLKGKILAQDALGLLVQIKSVGDQKIWDDSPTFKKIFVPVHKVDFVIVE